ncbi:hypothetical protein DT603_10830 [Pseudoxanthomonas gei]|uniref:DUF308 domain-containing protein n=2 Tax=Pseudoxanthomonas gei TaxID=1383030 RepID=A0ABX0AD02_9GAMM|nr:hypothetical protein [Pseudoxanthomonas gei]
MTASMNMADSQLWRRLRWLMWGGAAGVLLVPLVVMQYSREVQWSGSDFATMGVMLGLLCGAYEVAIRVARSNAYVLGAGLAAVTGFLLAWVNLAVGIIGSEDNTANLVFSGVLAVALLAVVIARLRPLGMAHAMEATALAQAATCLVALLLDGTRVFVLTTVFVALWLAAAQLFRKAARQQALQDSESGSGCTSW